MKKFLISLMLVSTIFTIPAQAFSQEVLAEFNPNLIIPDAAFNDTQTFGGPEGIQRFLESKGSVLANTSPEFLAKLSEPNDPALKTKLDDPTPNLGRLRTAAEIIWDASQASGINPQVILVTLNKEQSLITGKIAPERLQRALNHAMGFDCPDSSGCGSLFPGFYYQLMGNVDTEGNRYLGAAKSLMKSFNTPTGRGPNISGAPARVGDSIQIQNTIGDFANILLNQFVTIGNRATAALYRYTPHVFNGNYNFWRFFTAWFRYPNGTILKSSQDGIVYIIQDGTRQRVLNFIASARNLDLASTITVSPTELENYPIGPLYAPPDNTIVNIDGALSVFIKGTRHPASSFVLTQRKLDPQKSLALSSADAIFFNLGSQLTPTDGTVLRGEQNPDVFLVQNGELKKYSEFTFKQFGVAKLVQIIPDSEIASYPKNGYVPPRDGTVIQDATKTGLYIMSEQRRLPLTDDLFKNLKLKTQNIVTLTSIEEIASIPIGPPATPAENTYFTYGDSNEFFLFKDGARHPITPFVAKQRFMTPDFSFETSIASRWPEGIAVAPKNGTLIKSESSPTVYIVTNGQLRALTYEVFKNLRLSFSKLVTLPDSEVAIFAKGGFATPAENSYFVTTDGKFYVYQKGEKHLITPFVAKQRFMTPDFTFSNEEAEDWPEGTPIPPRNGTVLQGENTTTVYLVNNSTLRSLSAAALKRLGYTSKNIKVIPLAEINALPKGDAITK